MKQLNSVAQKQVNLERRINNQQNAQRRPQRMNRPRPQNNGLSQTQIPVSVATSVRNNSRQTVRTESGREQIGLFTMTKNSAYGESVKFYLNPLMLNQTRLKQLASVYQKFRFTRATLTIQSSSATDVRGLYIAGYNSNPDADYTVGRAVQFISTLQGSNSTNVWMTSSIPARLQDRSKWYNLDADSVEIMDTTQGYFAIAVQIPPNITSGDLTFPVWLDYTIQFSGTAANMLGSEQPPVLFPNGTFSYSTTTGEFSFTVDPDETAPVPATTAGQIYSVSPVYPITVESGATEGASVVRANTLGYSFAQTADDLAAGKYLIGTGTSPVLRSIWTLLN